MNKHSILQMTTMRTPLTSEQKDEVISFWVDGLTYREVSDKTGVSIASISAVINQARKKSPDIDNLRNLKKSLDESNTHFLDAQRGVNFLHQLDQILVPISELPRVIALIQRYGEKARDILAFGSHLAELENSWGKPYKDIVAEAEEASEQLSTLKTELHTLRQAEECLKLSIIDLQGLKGLQGTLIQRGITINRLVDFIEQSIQLYGLGFTLEAAKILASELARIGSPIDAAVKLGDLLFRQKTIEQEVGELQTKKSRLEQELKTKETERDGLTTKVELLKGQIKEIERLRDDVERIYHERKGDLAQEIHDLEEKQDKITTKNQECTEELESTKKSLDQAAAALKKMEEEVSTKKPLAVLAGIMEEPKNELPSAIVLESSLAFVQAFCTYLFEHPSTVSNYPLLYGLIGPVRRGLEDETRLVHGKTQ